MATEYIRVNNNIIAVVDLTNLLNKNNLNAKKEDLETLLTLDDEQIEIVIEGSSIYLDVDDFKAKINSELTEVNYQISLWDNTTQERTYDFIDI